MARRWNGWGDESIATKVPRAAIAQLEGLVGQGRPTPDALLADVVEAVPAGRLPAHRLLSADPEDRVRHARGQSLGDWIALRSGQLGLVPDAVGRPTTPDEVRELLRFAADAGAAGRAVRRRHDRRRRSLARRPRRRRTVASRRSSSVDLERLAELRAFDEASGLATFGAGVTGPALEAALRARGRMLGHEPQSWEYSTLGGWVVTRSSGQRSLGFGRIEALFAGGRLEAPAGTLELPPIPASAAGPDLRHLVLGSEGRLGILAEATVRTVPIPGLRADRRGLRPRLGARDGDRARAGRRPPAAGDDPPVDPGRDPDDAGPGRPAAAARAGRCAGSAGEAPAPIRASSCSAWPARPGSPRRPPARPRRSSGSIGGVHAPGRVRAAVGGEPVPSARTCGTRCGMRATRSTRSRRRPTGAARPELAAALVQTLNAGLEAENERVHAFAHLSHVYSSGTGIYVTYLFRQSPRPEGTHRRWLALKTAASRIDRRARRRRSATSTASGGTTSRTSRSRRASSGWPPSATSSAGSIPAGLMDPEVLLGTPCRRVVRDRRRPGPGHRLRDAEPAGARHRPARRDRGRGPDPVRAVHVAPARLGRAGPGGLVARARGGDQTGPGRPGRPARRPGRGGVDHAAGVGGRGRRGRRSRSDPRSPGSTSAGPRASRRSAA